MNAPFPFRTHLIIEHNCLDFCFPTKSTFFRQNELVLKVAVFKPSKQTFASSTLHFFVFIHSIHAAVTYCCETHSVVAKKYS